MIAPFMALGPVLRHKHQFIEIGVVHSGTGIHRIQSANHEVGPGDLFVVPVGVAHSFPEADGLLTINITMPSPKTPWREAGFTPGDRFSRLYCRKPKSKYDLWRRLDATQRSQALSSCRLLFRMMEQAKVGIEQPRMLPLFCEFLDFLAHADEPASESGKNEDWMLGRVLAHIERHLREPLDTKTLARATGVSTRSLQRRFNEALGVGPMQYVAKRRLERACELLRHDDLLIKEIAYHAGFGDSNYFSRCFRQKMGMSPLEYRSASGPSNRG